MPTAFKQLANNAGSTTSTAMTATGVTSIVLATGDGVKFPAPGNGFRVTLWNAVTYTEPGLDPQMEIVNVTARTTDTLTISATTKTHTSPCRVDLLMVTADITDLQGAVVNLENNFPAGSGAWTAYTPVWNATIGNGILTGAFQQIGKTIHFRIRFVAGTTSNFGTGAWTFTLPVATVNTNNEGFLLAGYMEDAGVLGYNVSTGRFASSTTFFIYYVNSAAGATNTYSSTAPIAWGNGDFFSVYGTYEAV